MKKVTYMPVLILVSALIIQSCQDEPDYPDLTWKETTTLSVAPSDSGRNFVVAIDFNTREPEEMFKNELDILLDIDWAEGESNPVTEVAFFIQVQEEVDGNRISHGHDSEIELAVISEFSEEGEFVLTFTADNLYDLLRDDFDGSKDRSVVPVLPGDLYEITWKLKGADGTVLDARNYCFGAGCQYSFGVEGISTHFFWWEGTFDYEWIVLSEDVAYYGEVAVGMTGSIDITPTELDGSSEEYEISHTLFDYYWAPGEATGTLNFDASTGLVTIEGAMEEVWNISNVNGPSLDIAWTYEWPDEWGTVTLTRRDGRDWPASIHSPGR